MLTVLYIFEYEFLKLNDTSAKDGSPKFFPSAEWYSKLAYRDAEFLP